METNFKKLSNRPLNGGIQYIARFENNYGASIVQHAYSYGGGRGLWELAVIFFDENTTGVDCGFELVYNTPITDDVIGYLEETEIDDILLRIEKL